MQLSAATESLNKNNAQETWFPIFSSVQSEQEHYQHLLHPENKDTKICNVKKNGLQDFLTSRSLQTFKNL